MTGIYCKECMKLTFLCSAKVVSRVPLIKVTRFFLVGVIVCACWASKNARAGLVTYSYDILNRITSAIYADGSIESYSYDAAGNRLLRTTSAAKVQVDTTPPSVPTNLVLLISTVLETSIGWNSAFDIGGAGLAGYEVFNGNTLITTTMHTNVLVKGLAPDTQYCISIAAYDHAGNVSLASSPICFNTPALQLPTLSALGLSGGQLQIGVSGGTPGFYDVLASTNLVRWDRLRTITLPIPSNILTDVSTNLLDHKFYELRWSTNAP